VAVNPTSNYLEAVSETEDRARDAGANVAQQRQSESALFRAFPQLIGRVPWLPLGRFPTRVERIEGLTGARVELWVKRDDESGVVYGGNKVRKLEFLLAEARARGAARVLTLGGIGSHHVLATAIYGRELGIPVDAVVFPQPVTAHVRQQILAGAAAGAQLAATRGYAGVPLAVWRRRRRPGTSWIASGGSSPTGTLGYVSAGLELLEQIARGELPPPDVIYVALGSCGTAAGLLVGLRGAPSLAGLDAEVVGVRVVDRVVCNARATHRLAARTAALLPPAGAGSLERTMGVREWFNQSILPSRNQQEADDQMLNQSIAPSSRGPRLRVEHGFFGGRYGLATGEADAAVARAASVGLRLEPTYTGKALAALLADADAGRLDGKRVLFIDTFNSVDLAPLIESGPGVAALPARLRRYFPAGDRVRRD
jgi:1-aminocyclopropane-1-carboxylate deaminase/D-cysteine desulfhydrase-like pyridoxal-dependent ACC family enzyme